MCTHIFINDVNKYVGREKCVKPLRLNIYFRLFLTNVNRIEGYANLTFINVFKIHVLVPFH